MKKKLEETLKAIDSLLRNQYVDEEDIGVISGLTGLSLFQFYYARYLNEESSEEFGIKYLELCGEKINESKFIPTYCSGISGFGWALEHLSQEKFLNTDTDEMLLEVDDYIYNIMISEMKAGNYDFLHGGLGYGFYFLKRYKNTKSIVSREKHEKKLFEFIRLLDELSEVVDCDKIRWGSKVNFEKDQKKVYNLSLSHGMSAIIGILTKLYEIDVFRESVERMLKRVIKYIRSFISIEEHSDSLFPNWIEIDEEYSYQSRLAWCYGDLGIGIRLFYASKILFDKDLESESMFVLKHSAKRRDPKNTFVVDAGLCHGSFGNALIFQRMYKETNEIIFKSASDFWINDGVKRLIKDRKIVKSTSLLGGMAGIGLTILNHLNEDCANWDECLLIS